MRLFGKDLSSYTLLEQQADAAFRAASAFHALSVDFAGLAEYVSQVDQIEHEADNFAQQLAVKIDSSSGTPIGKRDLHALSNQLEDITDHIEAVTARIALYRLPAPRPDLEPLGRCWYGRRRRHAMQSRGSVPQRIVLGFMRLLYAWIKSKTRATRSIGRLWRLC